MAPAAHKGVGLLVYSTPRDWRLRGLKRKRDEGAAYQSDLQNELSKRALALEKIKTKKQIRLANNNFRSAVERSNNIAKIWKIHSEAAVKIHIGIANELTSEAPVLSESSYDDQCREEDHQKHVYMQQSEEIISTEIQTLLTKMEKAKDNRLFQYYIVNLAEQNLADVMYTIFTASDRVLMKKLWKEREPTVEHMKRTSRKTKWDRMIKPLVEKNTSAMKCWSVFDDDADCLDQEVILEKPFDGKFVFKTHYDLLWVRDVYQRFMLLFASPINILRDSATSEINYRECFVNPIIVKAFDDLVGKITFNSGEVECEVRKRQRNETNSQKTRVNLGPKHDGILTVHVNAKSMEVGFMEVVGNAVIVDPKKRAGDREKLFKAMQISIFYQRQHHQERGATEDQILNIQSFGILVYQRDVAMYSMHRTNGGLYITDVMENFTIPDSADQAYVLEEIVNKVYFFK
ncbi:7336_t:CDS:10, partial [Paraglomus brasilianum]